MVPGSGVTVVEAKATGASVSAKAAVARAIRVILDSIGQIMEQVLTVATPDRSTGEATRRLVRYCNVNVTSMGAITSTA